MRNILKTLAKSSLLAWALTTVAYGEHSSNKPGANGWETILTMQDAYLLRIGLDDKGTLYETGCYFQNEACNWFTQKSVDKGQTWTTIDRFPVGTEKNTIPAAFAADHRGNLFAAGGMQTGESVRKISQWIVRGSMDGGKSWSIVDKYIPSIPSASSTASALAVDFNNNIYVTGWVTDNVKIRMYPLLRKSSDGGKTWATIYDLSSIIGFIAFSAIDVDPQGNVYVLRDTSNRDGDDKWIVEKSPNFGQGPWGIVDSYQYFDGKENRDMQVNAIKIAKNGDIYVAGGAGRYSSDIRWLVRKSSDQGKTWRVVDDFMYQPGTANEPKSIAIDETTGAIYVSGRAASIAEKDSYSFGILRVSTDAGLTWTTQDKIPEALHDVAASKSGDLYTVGSAQSPLTTYTRKFVNN